MRVFRRVLAFAVLAYLPIANADVPPGFEKPGLMDKIMKGQIVLDEQINASVEFKDVFRAYFNKVTPDAYAALAVNYPKYPDLIDMIQEAKQTSVNADHTVYTYWLHMDVAIGPFHQQIYPEGRHTLKINANGESTILNEITNYQDYIETATETTRLIPYQNGMLVEDTVYAKLRKSNSMAGMVKKQLQKLFSNYISAFRDTLQGSY